MKQKVIFLILLSILVLPSLSFAANEQEEVTLTTYYPAPYGNYTEIEAASITLNPQTGNPTGWSAGREGEFRYSNYNDAFFYYYDDGTSSGWRHMKEGSGGTTTGILNCTPGTVVTHPGGDWSDYSTCGSGYTVVGLYRIDLTDSDKSDAIVNDFFCDDSGCKAWCYGSGCTVRAQCCRIE